MVSCRALPRVTLTVESVKIWCRGDQSAKYPDQRSFSASCCLDTPTESSICQVHYCRVQVSVHCGSVLLRRGDAVPRRRGNFGGFLPHWQCIVQHSIWDPYENGWTDRDAVCLNDSGGPQVPCVKWGTRYAQGNGLFWRENVEAHCKVMPCAVQKLLLNRSTCRFGCRLWWAQGTMYYMEVQIPHQQGSFLGVVQAFKSIASLRCTGRGSVAAKGPLNHQWYHAAEGITH